MAYEKLQLKNLAQGTLISDSSSTIKVAGDLPYSLPVDVVNGPFLVTVDDEILKVTDVNTDIDGHYDYDVIRAQEDTSYATHSTGQKVFLNVTAGTINHIQNYLSLIDTTSNIDLNTIYNDTQTNNAKVTNANHTGDVTGSDVLGIVPAAISGRSEVTPANGDYVLLFDATDNTLKKSLVDTFITGGGGGGDITGPATSILNSVPYWDSTTGDSLASSNIIIDNTGNNINVPAQIRNTTSTTLSSSGSVTWNIENDPVAKIIPTGNINLTINHTLINSNATLYFKQDGTTPYTITWENTNLSWAGGYEPDLSVLGSKHLFNFFATDSSSIFATYINDNETLMGNVYSDSSSFGIGKIAYNDSTNSNIIDFSTVTIGDITSAINDISILTSDVSGLNTSVLALEGDVSGLQTAGYITQDSTNNLTNKIYLPKTTTLTSGTSINWSSSAGQLFILDNTGVNELMADDNTGVVNGHTCVFRVTNVGSGSQLSLDTTSAARAFRYSEDLTSLGIQGLNKTLYFMTIYNSTAGKHDVVAKNMDY